MMIILASLSRSLWKRRVFCFPREIPFWRCCMQNQTATHVLIAGSRSASAEMFNYAQRVVRRAHQLGWIVVVGDNPQGVDLAVVRECRRLRTKVVVAGVVNFPRNGGCKHGEYVKVERDLYRGADGNILSGYTVR